MQTTMMASDNTAAAQLPPGFRFHPTDEELILHYLRNRAASAPRPVPIIADVDIYKFNPWDLPPKAAYGEGEWYFFSPRDRKYPNGVRPNRAAGSGYWKATGTDKPIHDTATGRSVGVKKALVFYKGRPPKGTKTNWIMHEYRLAADPLAAAVKFRNNVSISMRLDDWVLCRIYNKSGQSSPIADYDHLDHDEQYSSGGFFYAPATSGMGSMITCSGSNGVVTAHHQLVAPPPRLPEIPSISDLFDLEHMFDSAVLPDADHAPFAVHPSLDHLLSVGVAAHSGDHDQLIYRPPSAPGAGKRKAAGECAGGVIIGHHHPPAKRLNGSCFDAPQPASGLPATTPSVLGGLNHHMLRQF